MRDDADVLGVLFLIDLKSKRRGGVAEEDATAVERAAAPRLGGIVNRDRDRDRGQRIWDESELARVRESGVSRRVQKARPEGASRKK